MGEQPRQPEGLVYRPEFLTWDEEQQALGVLEAMELHTITMHGQTARRTVRHFGLDYGYESWKLVPTDPLPNDLAWLQERAAALAGLDPDQFAQILISRYPPGSTIGWHRDAPCSAARWSGLPGVHLPHAFPARQGTRTPGGRGHPRPTLRLRPVRAARYAWQHSIPPTKALRYSITFRTLKAS